MEGAVWSCSLRGTLVINGVTKTAWQAVAQIESLRSEIGSAVSARGFLTDKRLVYDELSVS